MAAANNGFNMLKQSAHYYSSYSNPFHYHRIQQGLHPYVQPTARQQNQMWRSYLQQNQQQLWHSYLQQQEVWEEEQRRDGLKREILKLLNIDEEELQREEVMKLEILNLLNSATETEEEKLRREQLEQDISDLLKDDTITEVAERILDSDRRFASFLETDNSFFTPWNWKPDSPVVHGFSTAGQIKIEPGSLFSDNLVFLSEDKKRKYLSGTNVGLVSDESLDLTSDISKLSQELM